jgi:hypothetical protein
VLASVAGLGFSAGCGAGQIAQTERMKPSVPGLNADVGQLGIRDVTIAYKGPDGYAAGDTAPLSVWIYNGNSQPVSLTGVTVTGAGDTAGNAGTVVVIGSAAPSASAIPSASSSASASGRPSPDASANASRSATPKASASASAAPSASPSPSSPGSTTISIPIPARSFIVLVPGGSQYLAITKLAQPLKPGQPLHVVFHFSNDASVPSASNQDVPMAPPSSSEPRMSQS